MILNESIVEGGHPVQGLSPVTPSSAAPIYVNMANYSRIAVVISGVNDSTGSSAQIGLHQATDETGSGAKAVAFTNYWADTDVTSGDGLTIGTATSNTFATTATASKKFLYVVEVQATALDVANSFNHIGATVGDSAHTTVDVIYILRNARYADATPPAAAV